jgi:hypothetical protein
MLSALELIANISLQGLLENKIKRCLQDRWRCQWACGKYKNKLSYGRYKEKSYISLVEFTNTYGFMEEEGECRTNRKEVWFLLDLKMRKGKEGEWMGKGVG